MKHKRISVAIDVDGVIRDIETRELAEGAKKALDWIESKGHKIIITTANKDFKGTKQWLREQGINYPVKKIPRATIYFNDRNVRFISFKDLTSYL